MPLGDFSDQADFYHRARPSYPESLVDVLIADANVHDGHPVADLGAGTGIFTRLLVERGLDVVAIEPNAAMRRKNEVTGARWINGTFENCGLATASQRWAVAAQSFHWADPARSLPEIARILQPECLFTVLWNNRANDESKILGWTENAIRRHVPEFDEAYRNRCWDIVLESSGDFSFVAHRVLAHVVRMSKERYLELWRSHNRLKNIAGPARLEALMYEMAKYLEDEGVQDVAVPYRCESWSARRLGA